MALPHYKLQKQLVENPTPEEFPFLLVPNDAPPKAERLREFFYSKSLAIFLVLALVGSTTGLIWQIFDPRTAMNLDLLKNAYFIACLATSITSLLILLTIASMKKKQANFIATPMTFNLPAPKPLTLAKVLELKPPSNTVVEWRCEQWDSAPFVEVLEETVIAEVFSDEMIAPDHMVFSVAVEDRK